MRPLAWAGRRFRNLQLFWKLLVPFLVLLLVLGTVGTFGLVRSLSLRADQTLDAELAQRSLSARSFIHERELYVLESATLAANLQGMGDAVKRGDRDMAARLLESTLALKSDVTLAAVTDGEGVGLAQFSRGSPGAAPSRVGADTWTGQPLLAPILAAKAEAASAGFLGSGSHPLVAIASTVCATSADCMPVGAVIVAVDATQLARDAGAESSRRGTGVALYSRAGHLVAAVGEVPVDRAPTVAGHDFVRRNIRVRGTSVATLYSPVTMEGQLVGSLAVSVPRGAAYAAVRRTATRLGIVVFLAMVGVVAIGAGLSRLILGQLRPLIATTRALEAGDLAARVPVRGNDELGELAERVNNMANALQDSHEMLEARVEERTAEVQRLLQERTDFFTAVSHEFRTPLAVILGQARMLGDKNIEKRAAWHDQAAAVLSDAGNQLLGFVNDIVEIAKLELGRAELEVAPVRIESVLRAMKPALDMLANDAGLELSMSVPRVVAPVLADEARLREVISNLVDNATKYTPRGGAVSLAIETGAGAVLLRVSDTGVGIPDEAAPRLFEPFFRVQGNETQAGQPSSGLGLALVKGLVDAMGGSISFASEVGVGTTFTVSLPVAASGTTRRERRASRSVS